MTEPVSDDNSDDNNDDLYYAFDDPDVNDLEGTDSVAKFTEDLKCETLEPEAVECLLNEHVNELCKILDIPPSISGFLLHSNEWNARTVKQKCYDHPLKLFSEVRLIPENYSNIYESDSRDVSSGLTLASGLCKMRNINLSVLPVVIKPDDQCPVCCCPPADADDFLEAISVNDNSSLKSSAIPTSSTTTTSPTVPRLYGLSCGHRFCIECWAAYLSVAVDQGLGFDITCMETACRLRVAEDFVVAALPNLPVKEKYKQLVYLEMIGTHPCLRMCTGPQCNKVCAVEEPRAARVHCTSCNNEFCFTCRGEYHAPTDCVTIRQWLSKCRDDSGTAIYITAHTKSCPVCHICIEKSGGCNHMQCLKCQYSFCWMCLGSWKGHAAEYYVCSKYRDKPDADQESLRLRAGECLKRYLFHFERWANHGQSLRLEQIQRSRLEARINSKVMSGEGTWIDWQYLLAAADTLRKCRYTLKYTYPYAFYFKFPDLLPLFEYQQGLLEAEVEDLSWKIEHAEISDRAALQNKMDTCERHRMTLLMEFIDR